MSEPTVDEPGPGGARAERAAASLRALLPADVPKVAELERQLFGVSAWSEAMVAGELHAPGRWYVTAVEGADTVVGYAGLWFDGDVTQVMTIGVASAVQRQGIGAALLAALLDRSRELAASAVLLEVRVDNAPAMALYERFGFTVIARRRRYYQPEDADAWTMRLDLAGDADAADGSGDIEDTEDDANAPKGSPAS